MQKKIVKTVINKINGYAFEVLIDTIPDAIYYKNSNNKWVFANQSASRLFEIDKKDWHYKTSEEIMSTSANLRILENSLDQNCVDGSKILKVNSLVYKSKLIATDSVRFFEVRKMKVMNLHNIHEGQLIIIRDITESELAMISLKESEAKLKESKDIIMTMSANKNAVRELCNKKLSRELHDEVGHILAAMNVNVSSIEAFSKANQNRIDAIKSLIEKANESIRYLITNLRPPILDLGIIPTIEWQCRDFSSMFDIPCRLTVLGDIPKLSEEMNVNIFRIIQETLTNVSKHAEASEVNISISFTDNILNIMVNDDGVGFNYNKDTVLKSFGLLGINERAKSIGGIAYIHANLNKGCRVVLNVPIDFANKK